MASVNRAIILGNLGRDPESRFLPNGDAVCNFSVATSGTWKDKTTGEKKEATEWHRVVCFRKLAEIAGQYLVKGSSVYIEGAIKTRKWQDKDGKDQYSTEIVAENLQMIGKAPRDESPKETAAKPQSKPAQGGSGFDDMTDDVPF